MKYKFTFKKSRALLWRSEKIIGHNLVQKANRMDLFYENGSILSIACWDEYDLRLGTDWVNATQKTMEKESGKDIKLNIK